MNNEDLIRLEKAVNIDAKDGMLILLFPLLGLMGAVVLWMLGYGGRNEVMLLGVMYCLTMFGTEVGYHRYFTHRAFKTGPVLEWMLAVLGTMATQGPLL